MLKRCSQIILPVSASSATRRSCVVARSPTVESRYRRLPNTTGDERLPMGTRHARFSPCGDHFAGRFFSVERPSRVGPRHSGQSLATRTLVPAIIPAISTATVVSPRGVVIIGAKVAIRDIARRGNDALQTADLTTGLRRLVRRPAATHTSHFGLRTSDFGLRGYFIVKSLLMKALRSSWRGCLPFAAVVAMTAQLG